MKTYRVLQVDGFLSNIDYYQNLFKRVRHNPALLAPIEHKMTGNSTAFKEALLTYKPHIVMVAHSLNKPGYELLKWMRTQPRYDHVRMLGYSPMSSIERLIKYMELTDFFIHSTVNEDALLTALNISLKKLLNTDHSLPTQDTTE